MADSPPPKRKRGSALSSLPLPETVALVLQGGGALGSFQAGAYSALSRFDLGLDWVAGISIGAINAALIAGNPREKRREALKTFWDLVSSGMPNFVPPEERSWREYLHLWSAGAVTAWGVPGFFRPHMTPPFFMPPFLNAPGSEGATSFYDTTPLIDTLNSLIDWHLLNTGPMRLSVGAVDIQSGNFAYFDNREGPWAGRIDARHILASGALPPGFPAVEIDGRHYWDGGIVSNTPLAYIMDHHRTEDLLIFQVDLFPAQGPLPRELSDVWSREKDIRFSSRTRAVTDLYVRARRKDAAIADLLDALPPEQQSLPQAEALRGMIDTGAISVVHLIYRNRDWQTGARDFEFSPASIHDHWHQGEVAVANVLKRDDVIARNLSDGTVAVFDLGDPEPDTRHHSFRNNERTKS